MLINLRRLPVPKREFYRTGFHESINSHDSNVTGVDTIVDFRCDGTGRSKLENECCINNVSYINIPMQNAGDLYRTVKYPKKKDVIDFYCELLSNHRNDYSKFVRVALRSKKMLYGCYFGKDRTGIASFLLMRHLNVETKLIKKDYRESQKWLSKNIDIFEGRWIKKGVSRESYISRMTCYGSIIYDIEEYVNKEYESVRNYLWMPY